MWEVKKNSRFLSTAARHLKLWSLNGNVFFKEPHLVGLLEQYLAENIIQLHYFWAY